MKSVVVVCLVMTLSLFAGMSTAGPFGDCFARCFGPCCNTPMDSIFCTGKCMGQCALAYVGSSPMDLNHEKDTRYFCNLGCATSLCTKFSTKKDPAEKKVESCVDSCSRTCANA